MISVEENKELKNLSSMKIGGQTRFFAVAHTAEDVVEAVQRARSLGMPLFVVGSGSNIIWNDKEILPLFVVKPDIRGFQKIAEDEDSVTLTIGAGENWDETVAHAVSMNLSGIEAMSAIPGTVGATPVQNVGAYGQEIKDTLLSVEVFDTQDETVKTLSKEACCFRYRDSIFKTEEKGRYIILSVTLKLSKLAPTMPKYIDVRTYFSERNIEHPSLAEIRDAIIAIRKNKLPDPAVVPNCGSFFENPIVDNGIARAIQEKFPDVKVFDLGNGTSKIPAGWIIETCGLKGQYVGKMKLHDKNALVITNPDGATFAELVEAKEMIIKKVKDTFGITLENEPNIIQ